MTYFDFPLLISDRKDCKLRMAAGKLRKPIDLSKAYKVRMDILIYFKDDVRADADNVFKGIADALFDNDKYVVGSFDYKTPEDGKGRVEVLLTITKKSQ